MNTTLRKSCFLTLDLPRDNENSPLIMEQVLSAIHGAKIQVSIEIWAKKDVIQFALHCKNKDRKLLKSIIENHYQGIVIRNGEDAMPNSGYYRELQLDIADIFPIRRYSQAADYVTREHTDPWNELLASLRNTKNNELQGMQFIITPYKFHRKADHTLRICKNTSHWWFFELFPPLGDDFVKLIYRSWLLRTFFLWRSYGKNIVGEKIDHRRHDRESLTESAKSKIAQISFEVCIRLIYSGDNPQQKLKDMFSGFSQFNTKKLNAFRSTKAKRFYLSALAKRNLGKVVHLCIEELAGILAFPTKQVKITALQRAAFKVIHNSKMSTKSGILLGKKITEEQKIYLSRKDIKGHMAIVGRSGAGKSTVILKLVEDLISRDEGFCTLDPHGDLVDSIATLIPPKRITDTMLIDPTDAEYPLAFNIFATNIPKEQVLASVNDTFKKIFADFWGTRTEQVFRNALRLAVCDPKVNFLSITKILSDAEYRKKLLKLNGDPLVEMYWTKEFPTSKKLIEEHVSPLRNKLSQFLESPVLRNILGQNKNKIDFEHAIQKNKIVLIKLAKGTLGESNSSLLGNFFLHMITQAAFSQVKVKQRKSFPLFVDEMQIFSKSSDDIFRNILEEGRKYGLQLRAAFQHLEQLGRLESSIFGNIKTLVSFALGVDDSHKIAKYLEEISSADLVSLPQHFGYIRVIQDSMPVISSFKTAKPVSTQNSYVKIIQELSRLKYCRQRKNVEKGIQEYLKESLPIPS